jgi:predicted ATPase
MAGRQPGAPITRVVVDRGWVVPGTWPWVVPAVAQVVEEGLDLDPGVTVLVGANGSGKSTIVEGIAGAWARRMTSVRSDWIQRVTGEASEEDSPLHRAFRLSTTTGGPTCSAGAGGGPSGSATRRCWSAAMARAFSPC